MRKFAILFLLAVSTMLNAQIKVDFKKEVGVVKPVNGIGQPPMYSFSKMDLIHFLQEAGIPYSRLHDVAGSFGGGLFVDIPNVFRDFNADENDPASYDFAFTDILIKGLVDNGVEPYYRLGTTIENDHKVKAYRIFPPSDYAKWARICEHVIRHYNEGWADGFHYNITHWEIWNEPENGVTPEENQMWKGEWSTYLDFYGVVAPYLKSKFPHLMIGGYGSCGFYGINSEGVKKPDCKPRQSNYIDCFLSFLERARAEKWPLDFFSAHSYDIPYRAIIQMEWCRKKLDEYGFKHTQISVNEWLPQPHKDKLGTPRQAAEIATGMILFQNGSVDDAEIYDGRAFGGTYGPLFHPDSLEPRLAYYSFVLFNELRKLGIAVKATSDVEGLDATAAIDGKGNAAVLISSISKETLPLKVDFGKYVVKECLTLDEKEHVKAIPMPTEVAPYTVLLVKLARR